MYGRLTKEITFPEDVDVKIDKSVLEVKGPKGTISKDFSHSRLIFELDGKDLKISSIFPRKTEKAVLGSVAAHVNNMIKGVTDGFKYSMKIVFSHFPIKVTEEKKRRMVKIDNLYGGKRPRFAKIVGADTKITVDGENVYVEGIDKEAVGQTCANIQELTRLRGKRRKSPKTFMDGIFVFDRS